jgi:hypothetical protein
MKIQFDSPLSSRPTTHAKFGGMHAYLSLCSNGGVSLDSEGPKASDCMARVFATHPNERSRYQQTWHHLEVPRVAGNHSLGRAGYSYVLSAYRRVEHRRTLYPLLHLCPASPLSRHQRGRDPIGRYCDSYRHAVLPSQPTCKQTGSLLIPTMQ